jgi:hypothetical protein
MRNQKLIIGAMILALIASLFLAQISDVNAKRIAQIPTGSIPTVTGSPLSAVVIIRENEQGFVNVRSGPGTIGYEVIGILITGTQVPAVGRTLVGDWIQISYPSVAGGIGWIWRDLVDLEGTVPIIEPPPTITPRTTPTIDPTLAAQFLVEIPATRLPTFTPPDPITVPTFESSASATRPVGRVPFGFIIIGLAVLGIFGTIISFLRGR